MIEINKIYNGDALGLVKTIPDESIDLVVTDPPYESLMRWSGIGTTARMGLGRAGSKADDPEKFYKTITNDYLKQIIFEFYRILKKNTHCYVMCDQVTLPYMYKIFDETKFTNMKPLVWDKVIAGLGYHYRARYEFVIMFDKGKNRKLNDLSVPDVLQFKNVKTNEKKVPTQKPLGLFELLISQSTEEGELILDPFMGAGTAGMAAKRLKRNYIGCELDAEHHRIAEENIDRSDIDFFII